MIDINWTILFAVLIICITLLIISYVWRGRIERKDKQPKIICERCPHEDTDQCDGCKKSSTSEHIYKSYNIPAGYMRQRAKENEQLWDKYLEINQVTTKDGDSHD